jgi:predicted MFS family arabinose efflux permease
MGLAIQSAAPDQQGTAMGFFASLYAAGMTLGPILSGVIAQRWGLSSVFILNGFLCLLGAFLAFIKIPSVSRKES